MKKLLIGLFFLTITATSSASPLTKELSNSLKSLGKCVEDMDMSNLKEINYRKCDLKFREAIRNGAEYSSLVITLKTGAIRNKTRVNLDEDEISFKETLERILDPSVVNSSI